MKIPLIHKETLDYYDFPILWLAEDKEKKKYLCSYLTTSGEDGILYLCAPIPENKLEDFISGKVDLRDTYLAHPKEEFFLLNTADREADPQGQTDFCFAGQIPLDLIHPELLPAPGYLNV